MALQDYCPICQKTTNYDLVGDERCCSACGMSKKAAEESYHPSYGAQHAVFRRRHIACRRHRCIPDHA